MDIKLTFTFIICISISKCQELFEVKLPNVTTAYEDQYICTWKRLPDKKTYVIQYGVINVKNVHHMLIYKCKDVHINKQNYIENCYSPCQGTILFAWARNAPEIKLPEDVGFETFPSEYIFIQVHFREIQIPPSNAGIQVTVTDERQKYMAGIFLAATNGFLRPGQQRELLNSSCEYKNSVPLYPFAYRTHAHSFSRVISGYQYNGTWNLIGKSNPQWPNAFWPTKNRIVIKKHDKIFAMCRYDTTSTTKQINIGMTHNDEMCNFYVMYYYEKITDEDIYWNCYGNFYPQHFSNYPEDGYALLPRNADLEVFGEGNHKHNMDNQVENDYESFCPNYDLVTGWPNLSEIKFGQVASLAIHPNGNIYMFHRSNVIWDDYSFDDQDNFLNKNSGPINEDTIIEIEAKSGNLVRSFGAGFFYMPHGIHIDASGNFWFTDVAMHQVFKFEADINNEKFQPIMIIGKKFEHGSSDNLLCKPTDIAVLKNGDFFVADGYCNHRIIYFNFRGQFVKKFDILSGNILHSLSADEANSILYIADRVNKRILKLNWMTNIILNIELRSFDPALYAISFSPILNIIYAVNSGENYKSIVTVIDTKTEKQCGFIEGPKDNPILNPHDMQVSENGTFLYIAELDGTNGIRKFKMHQSVKKPGPEDNLVNVIQTHPYSHSDIENTDKENKNYEFKDGKLVILGSIIIASLLAIPMCIILAIVCYVRGNCNRKRHKKAYQKFGDIGKHDELKHLDSDSEVEEYVSNMHVTAKT